MEPAELWHGHRTAGGFEVHTGTCFTPPTALYETRSGVPQARKARLRPGECALPFDASCVLEQWKGIHYFNSSDRSIDQTTAPRLGKCKA